MRVEPMPNREKRRFPKGANDTYCLYNGVE